MDRSPLFAIGLTLQAPQKWVFGGFPLDLGFLMSSGFLGIFWLNLTKSGFLEALRFFTAFYYQFTDDTKSNGTETAVVMIFIMLLFHLFRTTSAFSLWH